MTEHNPPLNGRRSGELVIPSNPDRARRLAKAGTVRRITRGLYTENVDEPLERVVRRNWLQVLGLLYPGVVLVGRSAVLAMPTEGGRLFVDAGERKSIATVAVGPLSITLRPGPGPLDEDIALADIYLSSRQRAALENLIPSRRGTAAPWTLNRSELEDWLSEIATRDGEAELNRLRDRARELARMQGYEWIERCHQLDEIVGSILGSRDSPLGGAQALAQRKGIPYDGARNDLFDVLRNELLANPPAGLSRSDDVGEFAAFYEAYFSNFIEGTEFTVEEASEIVFDGVVPADRPEDAHDVIGTFRAIVDTRRNGATPQTVDDLISTARSTNALVLEQRPQKRPGEFKERANRAGATHFVRPELVEGTLRAGWSYYESLPTGFARAVFMMFLISEVHPFEDGNGRTARLMMNSELTASGFCRFIVPISFREDYLGGLRALSRSKNPVPLSRSVSRILRWVGGVDWSSIDAAQHDLEAVRAFDIGGEARLRIP
jgi:hypothetical protein